MATLIFTTVVSYTLQAILVGAAVACLLSIRGRAKLGLAGIAALFALFALLDLCWFPAIAALDATITIGNAPIAELLDAKGPVPLASVLQPTGLGFPIWVAETIVALITAQLLLPRVRSAA